MDRIKIEECFMKRSKLLYIILIALTVALMLGALTACSMAGLEADEYASVFVDAQSEKGDISFTLVIEPDKTFELKRFDGKTQTFSYVGECRTSTVRGRTEMLCTVNNAEGSYNPYFTVKHLDNGGVAAYAAGNASVFGEGDGNSITLVVFD